jgi:hypothetical protein
MKTILKGTIFAALALGLFLVLWHVPLAAPPGGDPPPPPPGDDDINPHFVATVGTPGGGQAVASSVFGWNPPDPPHKVALGETVHCTDGSWDKDKVPDGQNNYQSDPINQRWWYVGSSQEKYTSDEGDKAFDWLIEQAGEFIIKEKVEDDSPVLTKDDTYLTDCSAKFCALALEYITLTPGDQGASVPDDEIVVDISICTTSVRIDGTGYNYTYTGDGGDGERCYDNVGKPIPGFPLDDIQLSAAYDWSFQPLTLAYPNPAEDCAWTRLWHYGLTGRGVVTATYTKQDPHITGSAPVKFVKGSYFIDLTGINYDEVQNVPINGKAPASRDGTGDVGEMKARVVIEGEPNTTYRVDVWDDSSKLSVVGAPSSLTTNANGTAQDQFEIHAVGTTPSTQLEDITMSAAMWPSGGSGDPLAQTEEAVTVYEFYFLVTPKEGSPGGLGTEKHIWEQDLYAGVEAWHESSSVGTDSAAGLHSDFDVSVDTRPAQIYEEGELTLLARLNMQMVDFRFETTIVKAYPPATQTPDLSISFWILSVSIPGVPLGTKAGGFGGGDIAVIIVCDGTQQEAGDVEFTAADVPTPLPFFTSRETFRYDFPLVEKAVMQRPYSLYTVYGGLVRAKCAVGCEVVVRHVHWTGGVTAESNGVDVESARIAWQWHEPPPSFPQHYGYFAFSEYDNVFEIQ